MSRQLLADQLDLAIGRILAGRHIEPVAGEPLPVELLRIAGDLVELPRPEFKTGLRTGLERSVSMTRTEPTARESLFRPGFRTVTPYLVSARTNEIIGFLKNVFEAEETFRAEASPGIFHTEVRIGDSMLMIGGGEAYPGPEWNAELQVYVQDADDVYMRAINAGAESLSEVVEAHGDRFGCVRDPYGNRWYISTHLGEHYTPEHLHTVTTWLHADGDAKLIDFMIRALRGEVLERHDSPEGQVLHAKVRIGDSVIQTSEGREWWAPVPTMIYLYVPDADAVYEQALAAGAKSLHAPADQPYGDRTATVEDPFGNHWYPASPIQRT